MGKSIREFAKEMSVIMPKLAKEFLKTFAHSAAIGEISMVQMAILHLLKEREWCMMSDIARFLSVTTSAATGTVDRMVRTGLLKRFSDPRDRRIINVKLTPKGKKAINSIFKKRQDMMVGIFSHLGSGERDAYLKTVKKIHNILRRKRR